MKTLRHCLNCMFIALLAYTVQGNAQDIDLYSSAAKITNASLPNMLFVLDNSAKYDSNSGTAACTYADTGGSPNMGATTGGIEQCALVNAINGIAPNPNGTATVNIGIMVYNISGTFPASSSGGTYTCNGGGGGCLVYPLNPMTAANKTALVALIKGWTAASIKGNNEATASTMQEAWAYFAGQPGMSGRTYTSPASTGCPSNYVVFIGNAATTNGSPGDSSQAPGTKLASTINGNAGLTAAQQTMLTTNIAIPYIAYGTSTFSCGTYTSTMYSPHNDGSGEFADEWARYMREVDLFNTNTASAMPAVKKVSTYTIGVLGTNCVPQYPALLTSMANKGGGKYYATANATDVQQAIKRILNEVQAVNSVFASASLPVSVNAQGTYLNQIYMGMFRPDSGGQPRWVGNLKQYQLCYNSTTQILELCDSLSIPAISAATGFISPDAVSFWTSQNLLVEPDLNGGFWRNKPQGVGLGYDLPDGEYVEKGGAAQVIRQANLLDNYTATAGTATNPRNVYTYCPSGTTCVAALSDASNAFAPSNVGIASTMFGSSNTKVVSIVRTGTTALVTTAVNHGFNGTSLVTITGAVPIDYNVTQFVTNIGTTTFTITGLRDLPTSPTLGTYQVTPHIPGVSIVSITRPGTAASPTNTETATVTTASPHGFAVNASVSITSTLASVYTGIQTVGAPTLTTFTYTVPVYPPVTALNSYKVMVHPYTINLSSISKVTGTWTATTTTAHNFHAGETIKIASSNASFDGVWIIASVPTALTFTLNTTGSMTAATSGIVSPSTTAVAITALSRIGNAVTTTATATGLTAGYFANGDLVDITTTGTNPNEAAYTQSAVAITCAPGGLFVPCSGTTFTYPITTSPDVSAPGTLSVAQVTTSINIAANQITRAGATATVNCPAACGFVTNTGVDISASGTLYTDEAAYTGTWTITSGGISATSFTFGPVTLSPASPATGNIGAYSGTVPPDKTSVVNWVRGQDNNLDEPSPDPTYTTINVRPSLHGDVLHSRPTVINYGTGTGVVVYYGSNDGIFRAINGNQTGSIAGTPPGGELWGFIAPESFSGLTRLHDNSPLLLFPTTTPGIVPAPVLKDYFVDGPTGLYQLIDANGATTTAYIYLAMRRGGRLIYALDVSTPSSPKFLWKHSNTDVGFTEMGQTWSQPKVAMVKGYASPVLIFAGGYDPSEDSEAPLADTMGRGIFILDATTGALLWSATPNLSPGCTSTQCQLQVAGMNYSIPSDITLLDHNNDGNIDRLYVGDVGGNIWRVDFEPVGGITPNFWQVEKLAALGCSAGPCAAANPAGPVPRKFFYPPEVMSVTGYDAVFAGSGDREHPLYTDPASTSASPLPFPGSPPYGVSAYNVTNRLYMLKDTKTGLDGAGLVTIMETMTAPAGLFDATNATASVATSQYNGTPTSGYYVTLQTGEKAVNAPLAVAGSVFFGTNQPEPPRAATSTNQCEESLGLAASYSLSPFTGVATRGEWETGGLPPSPVAGVVNVRDSVTGTMMQVQFCIGCGLGEGGGGGQTSTCDASASAACKPKFLISTSRTRAYWYMNTD